MTAVFLDFATVVRDGLDVTALRAAAQRVGPPGETRVPHPVHPPRFAGFREGGEGTEPGIASSFR